MPPIVTAEEVLKAFANIRMAPASGGRAVHKPLLILFWLGRLERGEPRMAAFADVEGQFKQLLAEFGSANSPNTRHYPFWYLGNDDEGRIWQLESAGGIALSTQGAVPGLTWFRERGVLAGFAPAVDGRLRADKLLRAALARQLLAQNFPETLHSDIATQTGLDIDQPAMGGAALSGRRRDPAFRERVLRAYEYRCCVCGFDLRIGNVSAGLEAAHIQWFTADGPDVETNGMAMCALHHKIFDLGAFTVEPVNLSIVFSQNLQLGDATRAHLLSYHGAGIIGPQSTAYAPDQHFLDWHAKEVFKAPGRD
ncbi:MAG: restriction endonuclease [Rhodoferax sp.]|nr:restriction endonuclease [Rhodoferax sp.]